MAVFRNKTIAGVEYDLAHLEPFLFPVTLGNDTYMVRVTFECHVFTEALKSTHTPDLRYRHGHETRAFDIRRWELSKELPGLLRTQGSQSVYHTKRSTFFLLKSVEWKPGSAPYAVFFDPTTSNRDDADVAVLVRSAYEKPNMTKVAEPVHFSKLIAATANRHPPPLGPRVQVKRRR